MDIQVYANNARIEAERDTMNVTLQGVDLGQLLAQINTGEILDALKANDQFSDVHDWVIKELKDNEE